MDTTNDFLVGVRGDDIIVLRPITRAITKAEALRLAAYLVALADDHDEFKGVLEAVKAV